MAEVLWGHCPFRNTVHRMWGGRWLSGLVILSGRTQTSNTARDYKVKMETSRRGWRIEISTTSIDLKTPPSTKQHDVSYLGFPINGVLLKLSFCHLGTTRVGTCVPTSWFKLMDAAISFIWVHPTPFSPFFFKYYLSLLDTNLWLRYQVDDRGRCTVVPPSACH